MEFIITVFIVIFLFSWVMGKVFPYLIKWFLKKKLGQAGFSFGEQEQKYSNYKDVNYKSNNSQKKTEEERKEGKVTRIVMTQEQHKIIDNDLGEYVEFEETTYSEKRG